MSEINNHHPGSHAINMDDYQVANLSELLSLITTFGTPLNALASGDWAWEILGALPKVDHRPNQDKATQLKWIYNRLSWDGWVAPSNVGNDPQPLP